MVVAGGLLGGGDGHGSGAAPVGFTDGAMPEDDTPNVTPEEQKQYDEFVQNAMRIIYTEDGKVQEEVMARMGTGDKPIDTMAQTLTWLVMLVEQDATRNGVALSDDVLMHASGELLGQLVEVSEAAGLHEFKEAELQGAWYQALDMYREANSDEGGRINTDDASAAFAALNEADMEGRADEIIPGFEGKMERAMAMASADQNEVEEEDTEVKLNERSVG